MLVRAPEEERWAQLVLGLGSWIWVSFLVRRPRTQRDTRRAATAPNMAPGKNPVAMAAAGNAGQEVERIELVEWLELSDDGESTGVIVAWGVVGVVAIFVVVEGD